MGVVIGCFLEVIGEIEMCSKIPDTVYKLPDETEDEYNVRMSFMGDE